MNPKRRFLAAVVAALLGLAARPAPATDEPTIRILSPGPEDILVGEANISVRVTGFAPGDAVEIFADGRPVGTLTREPWLLSWHAPGAPRPHHIAAVLRRDGREAAVSRVRTRGLGYSATANARAVSLSPIVTDSRGHYVRGLAKDDFALRVDGQEQQIETFEAANSGLSVVLVVDVSTSMAPKVREAREAALEFLSALKAGDRVAVLTFASNVVGFTPFSTDKGPAREALEAARVSGETALYDATAIALRRLRTAGGRRAIVLFTDGEDNRSRMSIDQIIDLARAAETSVFCVAQVSAEVKALLRGLDRLAEETGGRAWFISTIQRLPGVFREVVTELENQYYLTFTPADQRPRTWHRIDLKASKPGLTVRTRKSFQID